MSSRSEQLFSARQREAQAQEGLVPTRVPFVVDKRDKRIRPLTVDQKLVCALRKVLAEMSDRAGDGTRYFLLGDAIRITRHPGNGAVPSERGACRLAGRAHVGVAHPSGASSTRLVAFDVSFHDAIDDLGLGDVVIDDPTTIDALPATDAL